VSQMFTAGARAKREKRELESRAVVRFLSRGQIFRRNIFD